MNLSNAPRSTDTATLCPMCQKEHPESYSDALERLKKGPRLLMKALRGIKNRHYERSYGQGKWSIRQIICHLRDCEIVYGFRYRKMLAEEGASLVAFDQDLWADRTKYAEQDPSSAAKMFQAVRKANVELLEIAGPSAIDRSGTHAEYGVLTVGALVCHLIHHDENHLAQIAAARVVKRKKAKAKR